jgi:hypothetical protein
MRGAVALGRTVAIAVVVVAAGAASVVASGVWKGTCAKCGHEWVRYAPPADSYEVCTFRPDDRGWCGGRIVWDRDPVKK